MPYPHPDAPEAQLPERPRLDLAECAKAWKLNAREAAAYARGWLAGFEQAAPSVVEPTHTGFLVHCERDQVGAVLAMLLDAGFNLATFESYPDGRRTVRVTYH